MSATLRPRLLVQNPVQHDKVLALNKHRDTAQNNEHQTINIDWAFSM